MTSVLRTAAVRVLDDRDVDAVREVLARDPIANVFVTSRVEAAGLDPWRLGAEIWGFSEGRQLEALCYSGANLVPVNAHAEAARAFADKARRQGRRCSSIVGPSAAVDEMWAALHRAWGPARDVRPDQPLMSTSRPSAVAGDPSVRRVEPNEFDVVLPACVAMFTEEVGISPLAGDGGDLYRRRVAELIAQRRAYARIEDGRVENRRLVRRTEDDRLPARAPAPRRRFLTAATAGGQHDRENSDRNPPPT